MKGKYLDKLFFSDDLIELKDILKQKIISINTVNEFGENALWFSLNNLNKVHFLIKNGINLNNLTLNKQNILFSMSIENYLLANMEYDHNIKRNIIDNNIDRKYHELLLRKHIRNKIALKIKDTNFNNDKIDPLVVFKFNGFNYPDLETRKELLKLFKSKQLNIEHRDIYQKKYKDYLNSESEIEFYNQNLSSF